MILIVPLNGELGSVSIVVLKYNGAKIQNYLMLVAVVCVAFVRSSTYQPLQGSTSGGKDEG